MNNSILCEPAHQNGFYKSGDKTQGRPLQLMHQESCKSKRGWGSRKRRSEACVNNYTIQVCTRTLMRNPHVWTQRIMRPPRPPPWQSAANLCAKTDFARVKTKRRDVCCKSCTKTHGTANKLGLRQEAERGMREQRHIMRPPRPPPPPQSAANPCAKTDFTRVKTKRRDVCCK